ncbi:RNA-directed DNA polymerase-like protein [Gossypium australe]|uniref:RNA-directed DNA polymerase-like protein n=1 Tax=Gossypium australe TaxID=47621 RepID=A0A5B6X0J0_9ROSI|nr:RNA-directed DNA polymerase-like protein [Gossypium australe]
MGEMITVESDRSNNISRESESKLDQVLIVNEFTDVFPKDLLGLPLEREVEFVVDFMLGLKEFKAQLQGLSDRDFIQSSVSP